MSALERIAHFKNRRDEVPNQELARDLAKKKDRPGIREIAGNLKNEDKDIQADCIKVLYEVGYIDPGLVAPYAEDFVGLLSAKNNRLVWGGMIALGTVAKLRPEVVMAHLADIEKAMMQGSVITVDNAVQTLAQAAANGGKYSRVILPLLLEHLKSCRPKDVPQHSEKVLAAILAASPAHEKEFAAVLDQRLEDLSGSGLLRVRKVLRHVAAA